MLLNGDIYNETYIILHMNSRIFSDERKRKTAENWKFCFFLKSH